MQVLRCPQVLQSDEMSSTGPPSQFSTDFDTGAEMSSSPQSDEMPLPVLHLKFSTDFDTSAEMSSSPPV